MDWNTQGIGGVIRGGESIGEDLEISRLRGLAAIAHQSVLPLDTATFQGLVLRTAVECSGADAGCLRVLDPSDELTIAVSVRVRPDYLREYATLPIDSGIVQAVMSRSGPLVLPGRAVSDAIRGLLPAKEVQQLVLVPLLSPDGAQGFVSLAFRTAVRLTDAELEWLRVLGTLAGTAMLNASAYEEAEQRSRTDALTGLASRSHFEELFRRELARARRAGGPLSIAMVDVDDFKEINDRHGHVTGDRVLAAVGEMLRGVRASDVVARYGGDEFVILLPDTALAAAQVVADRIREKCTQLNEAKRFPFPVHVSIGVRQMTSLDTDIIAEADAAMYADKRSRVGSGPRSRVDERELDVPDDVLGAETRTENVSS